MHWLRWPTAPAEWTRRRLQTLLAVVCAVGLALVVGTIWFVIGLLDHGAPGATRVPISEPRQYRSGSGAGGPEDELASRRLPRARPEEAQPGPLSTRAAGSLVLPPSRVMGRVLVPSGYPHTPEGAAAQLVAIDRAALEGASVARAQEVIGQWAVAGGPTAESWSGVAAVAAFLSAAGFPATGAPEVSMRLTAAMGFVKGTVGPDFVVPCIDYVLTVTVDQAYRVAVADCQRMTWVPAQRRWMIGAGPEPAPAPSLWPGTAASIAVGYRWLEATS